MPKWTRDYDGKYYGYPELAVAKHTKRGGAIHLDGHVWLNLWILEPSKSSAVNSGSSNVYSGFSGVPAPGDSVARSNLGLLPTFRPVSLSDINNILFSP
jgi:hypothetical protein